jgi:hypothetical protein
VIDELRRYGRELGIADLGVCGLDPGPDADRLSEWISRGGAAGMGFFKQSLKLRTLRKPWLNGQKSAVFCLFPYPRYLKSRHISPDALVDDYHDVVQEKLGKLRGCLEKTIPGVKTKIFVDTAPMMEKVLAVRAGLGFQGRNSLLIHPVYGSLHFLGGLVTNYAFEDAGNAGAPSQGCGACRIIPWKTVGRYPKTSKIRWGSWLLAAGCAKRPVPRMRARRKAATRRGACIRNWRNHLWKRSTSGAKMVLNATFREPPSCGLGNGAGCAISLSPWEIQIKKGIFNLSRNMRRTQRWVLMPEGRSSSWKMDEKPGLSFNYFILNTFSGDERIRRY